MARQQRCFSVSSEAPIHPVHRRSRLSNVIVNTAGAAVPEPSSIISGLTGLLIVAGAVGLLRPDSAVVRHPWCEAIGLRTGAADRQRDFAEQSVSVGSLP